MTYRRLVNGLACNEHRDENDNQIENQPERRNSDVAIERTLCMVSGQSNLFDRPAHQPVD